MRSTRQDVDRAANRANHQRERRRSAGAELSEDLVGTETSACGDDHGRWEVYGKQPRS